MKRFDQSVDCLLNATFIAKKFVDRTGWQTNDVNNPSVVAHT